MTQRFQNLTQAEYPALALSALNFADAHARQSLTKSSQGHLLHACESLLRGPRSDYFGNQNYFLEGLRTHTRQPYAEGQSFVTYSASIALDAIAKYLVGRPGRIGMITPTFDSVPALFRRSGLSLTAVPESIVLPWCDLAAVELMTLSTLILVTPNNPSGARLPEAGLRELLGWAARRQVLLVLDLSFRLLEETALNFDVIGAAEEAGASVLTVDDTGKTLPLLDTKLGVLSATSDVAADLGHICSDILLNVAELDLRLLGTLLAETDEVARARALIAMNRAALTGALTNGLPSGSDTGHPRSSVAWVRVGASRDHIVSECRKRSMYVLPGNDFFWDAVQGENPDEAAIRLPLLRDQDYFGRGIDVLLDVLSEALATSAD